MKTRTVREINKKASFFRTGLGLKRGVVLVCGGFDPIHAGHISLLEEAARLGNNLVIALNSDSWLEREKGYVLFTWADRKIILDALACVDEVIGFDDRDGTACAALRKVRPSWFCNGPGKNEYTTPESELCRRLDIGSVWNCGGLIIRSSVDSLKRVRNIQTLSDIKD